MKVEETETTQGEVLNSICCDECGMPEKWMIRFRRDIVCLDCLDGALKMLLYKLSEKGAK